MQSRGSFFLATNFCGAQTRKCLRAQKSIAWWLSLWVVVGLTGCQQSTIAPATPRQGGSPAVVTSINETAKGRQVNNSESPPATVLDRILHQDLFAALACEFADLRQAKEFSSLPWPELERTWQQWIGLPDQPFSSVSQWWILVDRSGLSLMPASATEPRLPMVQVLVFEKPLDREKMSMAWAAPNTPATESIEFDRVYSKQDSAMVAFDERTFAFGDTASLERLLAATPSAKMKSYWESSSEKAPTFRARMEMSSIRAQIKPLFEMAAQFGGNSSWSKLPDVLTELQLTGHIDQDPLVQIDLLIEDEALQKELGQWLTEQFQNASPIPSMGNSPAFPGLPSTDQMFEAESTKVLPLLAEEIQRDRLLEVTSTDQRLQITLKRPKQFTSAVSAMILDANRQRLIASRLQNAERIGAALRKYRDTHQKFPSRAAIKEPIADSTVPRQLSWRVAILPELGYQELYDQFDFSQAWDSEHNLAVAKKLPDNFPLADAAGNSHWLLPVANESLYSSERVQPAPDAVTDRRIWTAIVMEASPDRGLFWTNPEEPTSLLEQNLELWGNLDEMGVIMINADGQARVIRKQTELLKAVLTIAGGETMTRKDFLQVQPTGGNSD